MRGGVAISEFHRFNSSLKSFVTLQKKAEDAIQCIEDYEMLTEEQLVKLKGTPEEQELLSRVSECPTAIVIAGQDAFGVLAVLTRLLNESLFPLDEIHKTANDINLRPIKVQYAAQDQEQNIVHLPDDKESPEKISLFPSGASTTINSINVNNLQLTKEDLEDVTLPLSYLEIKKNNSLLKVIEMIAICPIRSEKFQSQDEVLLQYSFISKIMEDLFPCILYAVTRDTFTNEELDNLREMKNNHPDTPILFIKIKTPPDAFNCTDTNDAMYKYGLLSMKQKNYTTQTSVENGELTDDELTQNRLDIVRKSSVKHGKVDKKYNMNPKLHKVLCDNLGYLTGVKPPPKLYQRVQRTQLITYSDFIQDLHHFDEINPYLRLLLDGRLYLGVKRLYRAFRKCMRMCVLFAFDKAREIQITPKRINYAKEKESELYENLLQLITEKQDEIKTAIVYCMERMTPNLLHMASEYEFSSVELPENPEEMTLKNLARCSQEIQDLVVGASNEAVTKLLATRMDLMRQSYIGTLQRCLENLENDCRASGEAPCIVDALKKIMNAAHQVEMTVSSSSSLLRLFWQRMKYLMTALPGRTLPVIDADWKIRMAQKTIEELTENKLGKTVCSQLKEQLKMNHESFVDCMKQLEAQIASQLVISEVQQARVKKGDAPRIASGQFEVVSAQDKLLYGMPILGKELGRGQYGVVYGCKNWGGRRLCAVKSIVPVDEKHWKELALEHHYTINLPEHERIVTLRGCIIDHNYGHGDSAAAYLVMDRYPRDLHMGIRAGLTAQQRLQIAIDVTQGIRFLHSQGLIHRDIKLKNVLLDENNRGKITDLGFCKPEAMISGSVVGTPIHMAPEMFSGHYDNSVDVYAFAILYWYIRAGTVKLPMAYQQIASQEKLWNSVRKGLRPERLDKFDDVSWSLMQSCWATDPAKRPLLGCVEPKLEKLMNEMQEHDKIIAGTTTPKEVRSEHTTQEGWDIVTKDLKKLTADWIQLDEDSSVYIERENLESQLGTE